MLLKRVACSDVPYDGRFAPMNGKISVGALVGELNGDKFAIYEMLLHEQKEYFVAKGGEDADPYFHDAETAAKQNGQRLFCIRFNLVGDVDAPDELVVGVLRADLRLDKAQYGSPKYQKILEAFKQKADELFSALH